MGQKVHPGGFRVGVIHDWKSNWWTGKKEFPKYLVEDVKIREHIYRKLSHAGLSDILIKKDQQRITVRRQMNSTWWHGLGGPRVRRLPF